MASNAVLYPDFLRDRSAYFEAENRWRKEWTALIPSATTPDVVWRTPWLQTAFANGTPFLDGNPIFSAVCDSRRLGVRVIQLDPSTPGADFAYWLGSFAKGEPEEITELVVSCVLSTDTLYKALDLIGQWIRDGEVRFSASPSRSLTFEDIPTYLAAEPRVPGRREAA